MAVILGELGKDGAQAESDEFIADPFEGWGTPSNAGSILQELSGGIVPNRPKPPDISSGLGRSQSKRDIVGLEKYVVENSQLMVYKGTLCMYRAPCWRSIADKRANVFIRAILEEAGLGSCLVYQDYEKIRKNLLTNPTIQVEDELPMQEDKLNLLDGTYDLRRHRLYPHDPEDHFFHAIKCRGEDMKNCSGEVFEAFVEHISEGDPNVRQQLLELTALTILGKQTKYFFVLLGESNTGKTQFGRFLEELVGRGNVESIRGVNDFANQWTVGALSEKLLATCLDLPDTPLPKEAVGIIKQFVGDDPVKGEKKNKDPFTFYRKPMLLFAGNHPIRIPNMAREQALLNRMVVIPFRNPVTEGQMEQELYKKLLGEAPYIVFQALQAHEELVQNNFQVTRSELPPEYAPQEGRQEVQLAINFLDQHCRLEPGAETATKDIYNCYCQFVEEASLMKDIDFSRILSKYTQRLSGVSAIKRVGGTDSRGYKGLCLI